MNIANVMALADAYADANRAYPSNVVGGVDRGDTRAALEAAVTAQEKQIEQLTKQYESLRTAYGLMHGSSK